MNELTQGPAGGGAPTENERTWGMLAHLAALGGLVVPLVGHLLGLNVVGPLVIWHSKRASSAFVAAHAKEALNFNITVTLAAMVCALLTLLLVGFVLGWALFIAWLVMTLIAAIKASEGAAYRYPVSLRFVK